MSGDALTAGGSATGELSLQIVEVHDKGIDPFPGQSHQEVGAVEAAAIIRVAASPRRASAT